MISEYFFTKMHGLGNDFVMFNGIDQQINFTPRQLKFIANRQFGIGCDQILVVESYLKDDSADFLYRIFNADGTEVEQCGNGARCFACFVHEQGLTTKTDIPVMTASGRIVLKIQSSGDVMVDMGKPILTPAEIPFIAPQQQSSYQLKIEHEMICFGAVSMGNPHAVLVVDDINHFPVKRLGAVIEKDRHFPNRVNVGFMQIINPNEINLRVFERGVGETLACGTGACAAVVVGQLQHHLEHTVKVNLKTGHLLITWQGKNNSVKMTGPATTVFNGTIEI